MKFLLFATLFCLPNVAFSLESLKDIPDGFHGRWADHPGNCAFDETIGSFHPNSMKIDSKSISYFESGGTAAAIVARQTNEVAIIFDFYSEADKLIYFKHFSLSEDGNMLFDWAKFETGKDIYYRCAKE